MRGIHRSRDVQVQNSSIVVAGRDHVHTTHVHNYFSEQGKLKLILDAIPNFRKVQQDTLARATPGTIVWLLECKEFKLFIDVDGVLKILWGSGMPGAGKTILASIVIDRLEALAEASKGQISVGYFYIRYSDQDQVTLKGVLGALVKQTVERHPDCMPLVQQTYERHLTQGTQPTEGELVQLLCLLNQQMRASFYVLDALDEAPVRIRLKLIQTLSSLGARLFVTSRPLPALEARLPGAFTFYISAQDHDLDLHIEEKIAGSEDLQDLLESAEPSFKGHLISTVKAKCGGMFLHASLQLDALQGCFTVHGAMEILEGFPQDIEDVYHQTWARIVNSEPNHASLAKATMAWVLNAQKSMTINQLRHALATCPQTYHFETARLMPEAVILAACHGLITIDQKSKLVRLIHYTAKDPLDALLRKTITDPHSLLAIICVTLLADRGLQSCSFTRYSEMRRAMEDDPFLGYAYQSWAFHTQKSYPSNLVAKLVPAFIAGCAKFPLYAETGYAFDLGTPFHIPPFFNLPLAIAPSYDTETINSLSRARRTPLHWACQRGHYAVLEGLLRIPGVQVNIQDVGGYTALMLACERGHSGVVNLLLSRRDILVNLGDRGGVTALLHAARHGPSCDVVKLLLAHPETQVNLAVVSGVTALIAASRRGRSDIVELLLAKPGIWVNVADGMGWTALIHATAHGYSKVVAALLMHPETEVNIPNPHGSTPLLIAANDGNILIVELLLAAPGININWIDSSGDTAIKRAAQRGRENIVRLLLDASGVDTSIQSIEDGHTAISAAIAQGHHGVAQILKDFEAQKALSIPVHSDDPVAQSHILISDLCSSVAS